MNKEDIYIGYIHRQDNEERRVSLIQEKINFCKENGGSFINVIKRRGFVWQRIRKYIT